MRNFGTYVMLNDYSVAIATSHSALQPTARTLPTTHFGTKWRDRLDQSRNATWGSGPIRV